MSVHRRPWGRRLLAVAASMALLPSQAVVVVSGNHFLSPDPGQPLVAGVHWPDVMLRLGGGRTQASFAALAGAELTLGYFNFAGDGLQTSTALLDGAGTRLSLAGPGHLNRFGLGNVGRASMVVSGGALLDGRAQAERCQGALACQSVIGGAAGSQGHLTITGAGSEAHFLQQLHVGSLNYNGLAGLVGQHASGRIDVLDGGLLYTGFLSLGDSYGGNLNGSERGQAWLNLAGTGSMAFVGPSEQMGGASRLHAGTGPQGVGSLNVEQGALLRLFNNDGQASVLELGLFGGEAGMVVDAGRLELASSGAAFVGVGRDDGRGSLVLRHGAEAQLQATSSSALHVGDRGGQGSLLMDGASWLQSGTLNNSLGLGIEGGQGRMELVNGASWVALGNAAYGVVGRSGGQGELSLQGASFLQVATLDIGAGETGVGVVQLDGQGSRLLLTRVDGHRASAGHWGQGSLTVSGGALLDAAADADTCLGRWCASLVGNGAGSHGRLTVTGAGSEARFLELHIANALMAREGGEGWHIGTAGAATQGRVEVLDGALLQTGHLRTGGALSIDSTGNEASFADIVVAGAGSRLVVSDAFGPPRDVGINLSTQRLATTRIEVLNGGLLRLQASDGHAVALDLSAGPSPGTGGHTEMLIAGSGSALELQGRLTRLVVGNDSGGFAQLHLHGGAALRLQGSEHSYLNIGERSATGELQLSGGAQTSGMRDLNIGSHDAAGWGSLRVVGDGSRLATLHSGGNSGQLYVNHGLLQVQQGGAVEAFALIVGAAPPGVGDGEALIEGAGSFVALSGRDWHRVGLERGSIRVRDGGLLDAALNAADCVGRWCGAFLANNAGSDALLSVSGAGSRASLLSTLIGGGAVVTSQAVEGYELGQAGGISRVRIEVLDGGRLDTQQVRLGYGPQGSGRNGSESSQVDVMLAGAGSLWQVSPSSPNGAALFSSGLAGGTNSELRLAISSGARLRLDHDNSGGAQLNLAVEGGKSWLSVQGVGSALHFGGSGSGTRIMQLGRNQGWASASFADGAKLSGLDYLLIGQNGGWGELRLAGADTRAELGNARFAQISLGRGRVEASDGAQMLLQGPQTAFIGVGSGNASFPAQASLSLQGAGTLLAMSTGGWGDPATAFNPTVLVGSGVGSGELLIRDGAQLRLVGGVASTPDRQVFTQLVVANGAVAQGRLLMEGEGSLLSLSGLGDTRVLIGQQNTFAPGGGFGRAELKSGAQIHSSYVGVGLFDGVGSLEVDASSLHLQGQWNSQALGPRLAIGAGTVGHGSVELLNGSQVLLDNGGSGPGAALVLGGISGLAKGWGMLVAHDSRIDIVSQPGEALALIGQSGWGGVVLHASQLRVADGHVMLGREAGAEGLLQLRDGSLAEAAYVAVGVLSAGADGGRGELTVTSGSQLTTDVLEIGSQGVLRGSGTVNAGSLVLRGSILPGDSPGSLTLGGSLSALPGSRLVLEVQAAADGGFAIDRLLLSSLPQLDALHIEFSFLAGTDPHAFQASGLFDIDQFITAAGFALDDSAYDAVSFGARSTDYVFSSFSYTAAGGAVFSAQPVPEPQSWLLLAMGLGLFAWRRRSRSSDC